MYQETADIETASDDYARRFNGQVGQFFLETQNRICMDLLADKRTGASILDVGGGHGQLTKMLLAKGFSVTVTGSDDSCRKRLDANFNQEDFVYQTCDSLHLPFDDNSFDVVISFRLLPHATQWQGILSEMCRVAKTCILFDYPDVRSFNFLYRFLFRIKKNMEGDTRTYTLFSHKQMRDELAKNNYDPAQFRAEFFLPMVFHRTMTNRKFSVFMENIFRYSGITHLFGSPIIVRSNRILQHDQ